MTQRKMKLSEGWYPHNSIKADEYFRKWKDDIRTPMEEYQAGIIPHAGWYFSGEEAWKVIRRIPSDVKTVIIAGGHLPPDHSILCWTEMSYETPYGNLKRDEDLFKEFCTDTPPDNSSDNTIEIHLPLIFHQNPLIEVLCVRLPPNKEAFEWGRNVGEFCQKQDKRAFFLGSTDLTHYGYSYGNFLYSDQQDPIAAAVKKDGELLDHLKNANYRDAIHSVQEWQTACSLGGALGAAGFASVYNRLPGTILSLTGSYEKNPDNSNFVNYGTILF